MWPQDNPEDPLEFSQNGVIDLYFTQIAIGQNVALGVMDASPIYIFDNIQGIGEQWISTSIEYTVGDQPVFFIDTEFSDTDYYSVDPSRCIINELTNNQYELNWEDYEGWDYNDIIFHVRVSEHFIIPERAITIDGQVDDWIGVAPVVIDDRGDASGTAVSDLYRLYIAQDANYFYWRLDTADNVYDATGDVGYTVDLQSNDELGNFQLRVEHGGSSYKSLAWQWDGTDWQNVASPTTDTAVNFVIEMRFDRSYMAGYAYHSIGAHAYNHLEGDTQDHAGNNTLLDYVF